MARRSMLFAAALAIVCAAAFPAWRSSLRWRAQRRLADARSALAEQRFGDAAALADSVLKALPENAAALMVQAGAAAALRQDDVLHLSFQQLGQIPVPNRPRDLLQPADMLVGQ